MKYFILLLSFFSFSALAQEWKVVDEYKFSDPLLSKKNVAFTSYGETINGHTSQWLTASFVCNQYTGSYLRFYFRKGTNQRNKEITLNWKIDNNKWNQAKALEIQGSNMVVVNSGEYENSYTSIVNSMNTGDYLFVSIDGKYAEKVSLKGFSQSKRTVEVNGNCL